MATDALATGAIDLDRLRRGAWVVGLVGLALCAVGYIAQPAILLRSYLWAYCFCLGIALGSLVLAFLQTLTGGVWGLILRRYFEAATRTLPLLAFLFLPIALGLQHLYRWADPEAVRLDTALQHKAPYLNPTFFLIRAAAYFAIWIGLSVVLGRWSREQDRPHAPDEHRLRILGAWGILLYGLTITFASVDWIMSLEPHWFSTIFGVLVAIGQILSAMAFAILGVAVLRGASPFAGLIRRPHLRDLGQLLLAFVMVWAYMAFSQFLLIWSGNLTSETPYYLRRLQGGWQFVGVTLILFQFALPFLLLLSTDVTRDSGRLAVVAGLVLVMRMVDLFWMVVPSRPGHEASDLWVSWTDVAAPVGLVGIWLAYFLTQLGRYRILPEYDPQLAEAVHHE